MPAASTQLSANAKLGGARTCGDFRTNMRLAVAVMRKAQSLWAQDIAAHIASRTGKCVRTAEYWLADDRIMDLDDLQHLIESDVGLEILDAFMLAIPPAVRMRWIEQQQLNLRLARAERRAERSARERDQLQLDLNQATRPR